MGSVTGPLVSACATVARPAAIPNATHPRINSALYFRMAPSLLDDGLPLADLCAIAHFRRERAALNNPAVVNSPLVSPRAAKARMDARKCTLHGACHANLRRFGETM